MLTRRNKGAIFKEHYSYSACRMLSSVGRASPLQGEGRGFEPLSIHHFFIRVLYDSNPSLVNFIYGGVAKWPNAVDCKSIPSGFGSSNLSSSTTIGVQPSGKASDFDSDIPLVRIQVPQPIYVGPLAQSVEHVTFNHGVTSSNLVRITIFFAQMAEQVDAQDLKS